MFVIFIIFIKLLGMMGDGFLKENKCLFLMFKEI